MAPNYADPRGHAANPKVRPHGVVAVIEEAGRFLLILRGPRARAPGWWGFPGGTLESGETPAQALIRELREELGITVTPVGELWRQVTSWGTDLVWWEARWQRTAGNETLVPDPGEVAATRWVTAQEALGLERLLGSNVAFFGAAPTARNARDSASAKIS